MAKITTPTDAPETPKAPETPEPPPADETPKAPETPADPEASEPPPEPEVPAKTTLTLLAPDGCTSCSVEGTPYEVVEGYVEADPAHAVVLIESFGFVAE